MNAKDIIAYFNPDHFPPFTLTCDPAKEWKSGAAEARSEITEAARRQILEIPADVRRSIYDAVCGITTTNPGDMAAHTDPHIDCSLTVARDPKDSTSCVGTVLTGTKAARWSLLELPAELRVQIYGHVFGKTGHRRVTVELNTIYCHNRYLRFGLLQTCWSIYEETHHVRYAAVTVGTIDVHPYDLGRYPADGTNTIKEMRKKDIHLIQQIVKIGELNLYLSGHWKDMATAAARLEQVVAVLVTGRRTAIKKLRIMLRSGAGTSIEMVLREMNCRHRSLSGFDEWISYHVSLEALEKLCKAYSSEARRRQSPDIAAAS